MTGATMTALLERYETMHTLTQQMLAAAKNEEWDLLASTGDARTAIAEYLQKADDLAWRAAPAARKAELIRAILAADAEIKTRTTSWMNELQARLGSINTEKKLQKAYE